MGVTFSMLDCLVPTKRARASAQTSTPPTSSPQVSELLTILLTTPTVPEIQKSTSELIHPTGWTDYLARGLLSGLVNAIEQHASMAQAATEALRRASEEAFEFAQEHPVYTTILALGVLVALMPWVLEVLGFAELGPVEGSFAAWWQSRYAGYVPKGSLFSFFQRLGMVWH
ncbi:hypothetical protein BO99DRAFT_402014 [Aspergillus violaceofuscus CBS 115571]|uniref:Lincomycin-condensing protein lmbA n=1 Tax=Aspergillus violaceofuscus (strain CBS 115571) TaxID=1450538 RepID=A0A2V5HEG2_ASPV1|nr:hypothetical protein BO99DRAFT_402014 [Aspergillus violaceofuscus CBS 115571]